MQKTCATCAVLDTDTKKCRLNGKEVNIDVDVCMEHTKFLIDCEVCGQTILPKQAIFLMKPNSADYTLGCPNCFEVLRTCQGCVKGTQCAFETDPNPMPKVVIKTVKQGNMVAQTQVRNEEREKLFCYNCGCWDAEDKICNRTDSLCCGNFQSILSLRNP
jgi:hypothetical protein